MITLALVCQFLELTALFRGELVLPLCHQVLAQFSLAQMRKLSFNFIEVFVFEDLVSVWWLFREVAGRNLTLELCDALCLGL